MYSVSTNDEATRACRSRPFTSRDQTPRNVQMEGTGPSRVTCARSTAEAVRICPGDRPNAWAILCWGYWYRKMLRVATTAEPFQWMWVWRVSSFVRVRSVGQNYLYTSSVRPETIHCCFQDTSRAYDQQQLDHYRHLPSRVSLWRYPVGQQTWPVDRLLCRVLLLANGSPGNLYNWQCTPKMSLVPSYGLLEGDKERDNETVGGYADDLMADMRPYVNETIPLYFLL